jgi:hypothetical protein
MQFLLFDISSAVVFLGGYLTVVTVRKRRTAQTTGTKARPVAPKQGSKPREWPRLSYPR